MQAAPIGETVAQLISALDRSIPAASGPSIWGKTGKPSPEQVAEWQKESLEKAAKLREEEAEQYRKYKEKQLARELEERAEKERERLDKANRIMGERYAQCTFDNFLLSGDSKIRKRQDAAIRAARTYAETMDDQIKDGTNLVLYGPVGTGKDHMMSSIAKYIYRIACRTGASGFLVQRMRFCSGSSLYAELRSAMNSRITTESTIIDRYVEPTVLLLSDPGLPGGAVLSDYQRGSLFQIVDARYQEKRPVICTINAAGHDKIKDTLSAQVADRLLDSAVVIECNWPSFRNPKSVVRDANAAKA